MAKTKVEESFEAARGPSVATTPKRGKSMLESILFLAAMTLLLGGAYPLVVTGIAQIAFSWQANGSLMVQRGRVIGSRLIGQYFDEAGYFWGRPSATSPNPYDGSLSSGSNLTPAGSALEKAIEARVRALRDAQKAAGAHPATVELPVPADLVTASGSGLDPDISPAAAYYQVDRVAAARNLPRATVWALVSKHIRGRTFGVLGEPRVNVLELNLALDRLQ